MDRYKGQVVRRNNHAGYPVAWKESGLHDPKLFDPKQGSKWKVAAVPKPGDEHANAYVLRKAWSLEMCIVYPEQMPLYFDLVSNKVEDQPTLVNLQAVRGEQVHIEAQSPVPTYTYRNLYRVIYTLILGAAGVVGWIMLGNYHVYLIITLFIALVVIWAGAFRRR